MVKKLLTVIGIIILLCSLISCSNSINNSQGKLNLKIVDFKTGKEIQNIGYKFIITDLNKEFNISKNNSEISIPYKKTAKTSYYPYGYTTITSVKGYYPRIDHNFRIGGSGDAVITLEMTPIGELANISFVKVFHQSSDVEIAEFLDYYNLSDKK
ncbi:MAG: hypothetical protein H7Y18_06175 [Clostridiaceae bacterium]|nr:hypothetical protein [Clostridiaceae bacterium]